MQVPSSTVVFVMARTGHPATASGRGSGPVGRGARDVSGTSSSDGGSPGYRVVTLPYRAARPNHVGIEPYPSTSAKTRPKLSHAK